MCVLVAESNEMQIRSLIDRTDRYTIPIYQRDYSWGEHQVDQFLNDLIDHMEDYPNNDYYFFGTCYLVPDDDDGKYVIVDGQQRITTVITFLIVMRDILWNYEYKEAAKRINEFIMIDHESEQHPRLTLNDRNNKFFQNSIVKIMSHKEKMSSFTKPAIANKRLVIAYKKIHEFLMCNAKENCIDETDPREYFAKIENSLLKYFVLLVNKVKNEETAQLIFDTVNRRGVGLFESDYVKNIMLQLAKKKGIDVNELNGRWLVLRNIINKIGGSESHFLRHYLLAYHKRTSKKEIAENILELAENHIEPDDLVEKLIQVAQNYECLKNPDMMSFNGETFNALKGLSWISADIVYPVLLIACEKYNFKSIQLQNIVKMILVFFFRVRTIGKTEESSIEKKIAIVCKILRENEPSNADIKSILTDQSVYPSDKDFRSQFDAYSSGNNNAVKYILNELNADITQNNYRNWEYTLEHIMPKHLTDEWIEELKRLLNTDSKDECISYHDEYLGKLGNLTLLRKNPNAKAKDKLFKNKMKLYNEDPALLITKQLTSYENWGKDELLKRHEEFTNRCINIWKL